MGRMIRGVAAALVLGVAGLGSAWAVDVNRASLEELEQIKGVGPAIAQRIVAERKSGGNFKNLDDLQARVSGVGPQLADNISRNVMDKDVGGGAKERSVAGATKAADSAKTQADKPAKALAKADKPMPVEAAAGKATAKSAKADDAKDKVAKTKDKADDAKDKVAKTKAKADDAKGKADDAKAKVDKVKAKADKS